MINYDPLKLTLKEKGKVLSDFRELVGLNAKTQAQISKNEPVSISTLIKLCQELEVPIEKVIYIEYKSQK
ncbi:helix-turn-helix transcriptional regulator [Bacillus sp. 03113]|uniref:helix-turn-helix domain-containing protein n=1 Tax=Bacillus sp. 03113 TaxID=2578211 RepID=UPI0011440C36|nr:helix-turn-helix transcriptional regulator [Bacillus sp. 03113]